MFKMFSEYTPGPGSVPNLSVMEARFLRLASDLKLSTSQADGVARYIQQQNHQPAFFNSIKYNNNIVFY